PALKKLNPGVSLPAQTITTVHRSDNSGTTFNFTDYLSSVSSAWKSKFGHDVAVDWPNGTSGKGSSGVAAQVSQTPGAIGYVDVAYALANHLKYFAVQNRSGKFTTPGLRGILSAATSDQRPAADNSLSIVNPPKKFANAYPISTFTYVIVPVKSAKAPELKKTIFWALTKGQKFGPKLLFAPLPKSVLVVGERTLKKLHS
ncbi:MAG TPA: substrate-binding domain-containing protein, partial [Gaiellaceae bacterium]